jgi:hypothetical protein
MVFPCTTQRGSLTPGSDDSPTVFDERERGSEIDRQKEKERENER